VLISVGLGLIIGAMLALTGAGGGILAVPLLVFGVGLSVSEAGPISLLAIGIAAMLGAGLGLKSGTVRYKAVLLMAGTGMLISPFGIWLAKQIDNHWLGIIFAIVLLLVSYQTFRKAHGKQLMVDVQLDNHTLPCVLDTNSGRFVWTVRCALIMVVSGSIAGLLTGLLGVGGGFVIVPALQRYTNLVMQSIISTSLAVIALVSMTGVVSSVLAGSLNWAIAIPFCAGALTGIIGGRLISSRLAGPQLQYSFAVVSVLVAAGMIYKYFL
jgi:hypothetical protein